MNLRQFLLALRARFRVFALSLVAVVLAAAVASLVMPKSYRATVSLLVDSRSEQSMGEGLRELGMPQEHLSYLQTQADILASPKVARRVVEQLKLAESPAALAVLGVRASGAPRLEDVLVERLQHMLKVETTQSSVIRRSNLFLLVEKCAVADAEVSGGRTNLRRCHAALGQRSGLVEAYDIDRA